MFLSMYLLTFNMIKVTSITVYSDSCPISKIFGTVLPEHLQDTIKLLLSQEISNKFFGKTREKIACFGYVCLIDNRAFTW